MKKMSSIDVKAYAKIAAVTGLIIGLLFGVFGFVGMYVAEGMMGGTMEVVFDYAKDDPEYDPKVNGMMATMIAGIARTVAESEKMEKNDKKGFEKMFPKKDLDEGNLKNTLTEIHKVVSSIIGSLFFWLRLLILIGLPIGFAMMAYILALIAGTVYNKMNGMGVAIE
ncbi:MAG: hypothetical protein IEMM0008_1734 [bacterium]|nr:MAG: hypothetical protein IEMM0008_1734 [bacterium]